MGNGPLVLLGLLDVHQSLWGRRSHTGRTSEYSSIFGREYLGADEDWVGLLRHQG